MLWFTLLLILIAFLNKKSKKVAFLLFAMMFLFMGFNTGNADYSMYQVLYNKYGSMEIYLNTEILFQYLCKIIYSFGKNYNFFLTIYSAIGFSFMYLTTKKTSKYPALVAVLYFIFCFFLDAVQIRHFMASSIICYALTYLLKDNYNYKDIIKYVVLNFIAVGFHFISILYFLFLLLPMFRNKKLKNIFMKIIIPTCILFLIINSNIFIKFIALILPKTKIEAYFLSGDWKVSTIITIILILIQFIPLVTLVFAKKITKSDDKLLKNVIILNIILILITPFYFYTVEFGRTFRGIILIDYIALTNLYPKKRFMILLLSISLAAILFIALIIVMGLFNKTVLSIITNNSLGW